MKSPRNIAATAGALTLLLLAAASAPPANAGEGSSRVELTVLGGIQALNQNDTALPDQFLNIPAALAVQVPLNPTWALEGEFAWLIPIKRSIDLGAAGTQDLKSPDVLTYQANVVANLPVLAASWTPYLTGGLGAVSFLSNSDPDRYPQLSKTQTAFGINFGGGATYGLGDRLGLRADFREVAAFPSKDATGLSNGGKADPIWMERGTLGLSYRF